MKSIVLYRMPNESDYYCLSSVFPFEKNSSNKEGFFFSEFEHGTTYSLKDYKTEINSFPSFNLFLSENPIETCKQNYLSNVSKITKLIQTGEFEKVVFSKVKLINKKSDFELEETFNSLCKAYPESFVYCVSSQETGTWIGASPELLIEKKLSNFKTVSLAGTRLENIAWTRKERNEQQVVTDYISKTIEPFSNSISISDPYDSQTGKIIHLKSDISFELNKEDQLWELLGELNPTPAVCGIPMGKAKELILDIENHKRELYTGFIGPMGINNHNSLFVNLRNMKVCENKLALFLGGGIMGDSNPEKEWKETEDKASTLLSIL